MVELMPKKLIRRRIGGFFVGCLAAIAIGVAIAPPNVHAQEEHENSARPTPSWHQQPTMPAPSETQHFGGECAECSSDDDCEPCAPCVFYNSPLAGRLWVRGEYLLWWLKGSNLPPLVTTSPSGTPSNNAGVLGQSGTSILYGDSTVCDSARSGGRFSAGYWLDPSYHCWGIEASYVGIGRETSRFSATNSETPILARPYQDGGEYAYLVAYPNYLNGSVNAETSTDFQSVDVLMRRNLLQNCCMKLDLVAGWRYTQLDESLAIEQSSVLLTRIGVFPQGTTRTLFDHFDAGNQFNGAQLGVVYQEHVGRWSIETQLKLGLGNTHSRVTVDGGTTVVVPSGGTSTTRGGMLAQGNNLGVHEQDQFSVIPEVGITLGYDVTCQLRATFGYTFLYWTRVARVADQIDTTVNTNGGDRPAFSFLTSDFWAQGMNLGLEYRF
jgi:hypothetical protein